MPANLQISSSFAGANGVLLSGGAGAYLSVYAPTTSVGLSGGSPVYGALLGKTLALSGGSAVHYDVQLVTVWAGYFAPHQRLIVATPGSHARTMDARLGGPT